MKSNVNIQGQPRSPEEERAYEDGKSRAEQGLDPCTEEAFNNYDTYDAHRQGWEDEHHGKNFIEAIRS